MKKNKTLHFVDITINCIKSRVHTVGGWVASVTYSDGDNIIIIIYIIIIIIAFIIRFLLYDLSWFCVGCVGITLVVLVLRWLLWYFVGSVGISLVALVLRWFLSPR